MAKERPSTFTLIKETRSGLYEYFGDKCCAVVACMVVSNMPKEYVLQQLLKDTPLREVNKRGMCDHQVQKLLDRLGVQRKEITRLADPQPYAPKYGRMVRGMLESELKKLLDPTKTYLIRNRDHMWVIRNGVNIDPVWYTENPQTSKRVICDVYEILE